MMRTEPAGVIANSELDENQEHTLKGFLPLTGAMRTLDRKTWCDFCRKIEEEELRNERRLQL